MEDDLKETIGRHPKKMEDDNLIKNWSVVSVRVCLMVLLLYARTWIASYLLVHLSPDIQVFSWILSNSYLNQSPEAYTCKVDKIAIYNI